MSKVALLVGIDEYPGGALRGCVDDVERMRTALYRNHNGDVNFECRCVVTPTVNVTRAMLKKEMERLFSKRIDMALFYFAGHGALRNLGGYLVTQDARDYDEGVSMADLLKLADESPARERIVILDCCHSGALGKVPALRNDGAMLGEGITLLSASGEQESAMEGRTGGLFTSLVCDALNGGAADIRGRVTIAGVYAYVNEMLGGLDQTPELKMHVSKLVTLRRCAPAVKEETLRLLPVYFEKPTDLYPLDPSYEPSEKPRNRKHEKIFKNLQDMRDAGLVIPHGAKHLYYAAMRSKRCRLTPLGMNYWRLVVKGRV